MSKNKQNSFLILGSVIFSFLLVSAYALASTVISTNIQTGGTLNVSGQSTLASLKTTGPISASSTLQVTGLATFYNNIILHGTLDVQSATSTFSNGIDLSAGCFAINGTCVGGSSVSNLNDLSDVNATASYGNIIYYDGSQWTSLATSSLSVNLQDTTGTLQTSKGGTGQDFSASTGFVYLNSGVSQASSTIADGYFEKTGDWTGTFDGQEGSYYTNAQNLTNFGIPFYTFFNATTTDALSEGSTNLYWTNDRFDSRLTATTALPALTTLSGLSSLGTLGATTTAQGNLAIAGAIDVQSSSATSTFSNGIDLTAGCFAINGTCVASSTYTVYDPDMPPASPSSLDDEFDDGSVDAKWNTFQGTGLTVSEANHMLKMVAVTNAGNKVQGIYQSLPAGDFTVVTKVSLVAPVTANFLEAGLILYQDAASNPNTSDLISFGLAYTTSTGYGNPTGPYNGLWDQYDTWNSCKVLPDC
jgi:hypothetical protein